MEFQVIRKNLYFNVEVDSGVSFFLNIDPKRYKQILYNLIGNAIKFTFEGGIAIRVKSEGNLLLTECEDTGIGISEEDLSKLFHSFGKL